MHSVTDLSTEEYRLLAELRYRIRRFVHFSERAARDAGLEPQQHQLLLAIRGLPSGRLPSIGELAERLQLAQNTAQELIRRAERRGLVATRQGTDDRRQVLVELTEPGELALHRLSMAHLAELRSEASTLIRWLSRITT